MPHAFSILAGDDPDNIGKYIAGAAVVIFWIIGGVGSMMKKARVNAERQKLKDAPSPAPAPVAAPPAIAVGPAPAVAQRPATALSLGAAARVAQQRAAAVRATRAVQAQRLNSPRARLQALSGTSPRPFIARPAPRPAPSAPAVPPLPPPRPQAPKPVAPPAPPVMLQRPTPAAGQRASADSASLRRWMRPQTMRQQFILTELLQPPLSLRDLP